MAKNKNIFIVLLVLALAVSLYMNISQKPTQNSDTVESNITSSELFKRKQECSSYQQNIESKLKEMYFANQNISMTYILDEIWFSPSRNTCMYSTDELIEYLKEGELLYAYGIYDLLENKLLDHISEIPGSVSRNSALTSFDNLKAEYKQ